MEITKYDVLQLIKLLTHYDSLVNGEAARLGISSDSFLAMGREDYVAVRKRLDLMLISEEINRPDETDIVIEEETMTVSAEDLHRLSPASMTLASTGRGSRLYVEFESTEEGCSLLTDGATYANVSSLQRHATSLEVNVDNDGNDEDFPSQTFYLKTGATFDKAWEKALPLGLVMTIQD